MAENGEQKEGIGSWIPNLFYDIIGRVVPGTFLLIATLFTFYGPDATLKQLSIWLNRNTDSYPPALITISLTLLFSYIIAVLLGGMRWIFIKLIPLYYRQWVKRKLSEEVTDKEREFSMRYDFIKYKSPSAGSRISKLSAESLMANTLIMGFAPLTLINLWLYFSSGNRLRGILGILFLLIFIASIGARRYFDFYRNLGVESHAKLHGYEEFRKSQN